MKKITLLLTLILSMFLIVSCVDESFSLKHDSNIETNLKDLNKIKKDTLITVNIKVKDNKEIDYLLFNDEKVFLTKYFYTFKITTDTFLKVYYKDDSSANYFSLMLHKDISANVSDLSEVPKNKLITLTISVPPKRVFDYLKINNEKITNLESNTYSFNITKNTVVNVFYKFEDNYKKATLIETIAFGNLLKDMEFIKEGTIETNLEITTNDNVHDLSMLTSLDENQAIKETSGSFKYNNDNSIINFYYYNEHSYIEIIKDEEVNKVFYLSDLLLMKINNLEDFTQKEDNDLSNFEFLSTFISEFVQILINNVTNQNLYDSFFLLKRNNEQKILVVLNKEMLLSLNGLEQYKDLLNFLPDFDVVLEVYFTDFEFDHLDFEIKIAGLNNIKINGDLSYSNRVIIEPVDKDEYLFIEEESYQYKIYLKEEDLLDVELAEYLVDLINNNLEFIDYDVLNNLNIVGLYIDKDFNTLLQISDLKDNNLNIYIKWKNT